MSQSQSVSDLAWIGEAPPPAGTPAPLTDEQLTVLWAGCALIQDMRTLCMASTCRAAVDRPDAMRPLNDIQFQVIFIKSGVRLGLVNPLNLSGM